MDIILSGGETPLYRQIAEQIKRLILTGQLRGGDGLPSIRLLAKELRISVITTKRAYEELEREGLIETSPGRGSYVRRQDPGLLREGERRELRRLLGEAILVAGRSGIAREELAEMLDTLWLEE